MFPLMLSVNRSCLTLSLPILLGLGRQDYFKDPEQDLLLFPHLRLGSVAEGNFPGATQDMGRLHGCTSCGSKMRSRIHSGLGPLGKAGQGKF